MWVLMSKSVTRKVLLRGKDNVIEVVGFLNITKLLLHIICFFLCNFIESGCFNKSIFLTLSI